ncbi:hypothetical protein V8C86DRAFT_1543791 [Haematococcus lacustris]
MYWMVTCWLPTGLLQPSTSAGLRASLQAKPTPLRSLLPMNWEPSSLSFSVKAILACLEAMHVVCVVPVVTSITGHHTYKPHASYELWVLFSSMCPLYQHHLGPSNKRCIGPRGVCTLPNTHLQQPN